MNKTRFLTGITTTGTPHLGNYVGAIRPAIEASRDPNIESYYFLADYHAIIKCHDPEQIKQSTREIAATWLALGLDTGNSVFYRQSDIPEIMELAWVLTCMTAKGLMNRAHAYKAAVQENKRIFESSSEGKGRCKGINTDGSQCENKIAKNCYFHRDQFIEIDQGITMGLFSYPILMSADILMFNAEKIPVGKDQIQHVEMARDIAQRFNHHFGETFTLPEPVVDDDVAVLSGLDGRKMSKSYGNTIPLFDTPKKLQKSINKIKTNLLEPGEPKNPHDSTVLEVWDAFANNEQKAYMREQFAAGIAWGQAKKELFALIDGQIGQARERYVELMAKPDYIERRLQTGAELARQESRVLLGRVREAIGIVPIK